MEARSLSCGHGASPSESFYGLCEKGSLAITKSGALSPIRQSPIRQ